MCADPAFCSDSPPPTGPSRSAGHRPHLPRQWHEAPFNAFSPAPSRTSAKHPSTAPLPLLRRPPLPNRTRNQVVARIRGCCPDAAQFRCAPPSPGRPCFTWLRSEPPRSNLVTCTTTDLVHRHLPRTAPRLGPTDSPRSGFHVAPGGGAPPASFPSCRPASFQRDSVPSAAPAAAAASSATRSRFFVPGCAAYSTRVPKAAQEAPALTSWAPLSAAGACRRQRPGAAPERPAPPARPEPRGNRRHPGRRRPRQPSAPDGPRRPVCPASAASSSPSPGTLTTRPF